MVKAPSKSIWSRVIQALKGNHEDTAERSVAISGTGDGDYFIRTCTAYDVFARMKYGKRSLRKASDEAIRYLGNQDGKGGLIAVDDKANCEFRLIAAATCKQADRHALSGKVAMPVNSTAMFRGTIDPVENVARVAVWPGDKLTCDIGVNAACG